MTIYHREDIQSLLKDVKNYVKASVKGNWCIIREIDLEVCYPITDGFGLWLLPDDQPCKFKLNYENGLVKMRTAKGKAQAIRETDWPSLQKFFLRTDQVWSKAGYFELDFHPKSGFSARCYRKADDPWYSTVDLGYLMATDDLAKEFEQFQNYTVYIRENVTHGTVRIVDQDGAVFAVLAPLVQETVEY